MLDETVLHEKARAAVQRGKPPHRHPDRMWGGSGVGADCAVCERLISGAEMELEIEFAGDGGTLGCEVFHVHIRCFAAWELERDRAAAAIRPDAETIWRLLEAHRGEMFCTQCIASALLASKRIDRALLRVEGRGAQRRYGRCSVCGRNRLVCGLVAA